MVSALIIASKGSEDIELVTPVDVLRRSKVDVTVASLQDTETVLCTNGSEYKVNCKLSDVKGKTFDAVILPGGGPGSKAFAESSVVGEILKNHEENGKIIAAICAAPIAFSAHKIASGATITSYPCFEEELVKAGYKYSTDRVVVYNDKVVTSRGPGTAMDFSFKLSEMLAGKGKADEVRKAMLII
ncbi:Protein DJ-1 [Strongyloides ratti]|uniref:D-lactate dehydratase n=1 Tax=Strongyloides ratti TaxID=34506 RepID=A0A090L4X5_STRRB|nr:Protein DJ-1 [Strongyloides ratti]CEF62549.1 Protein DJ-1 [Strongyloides ratti]